MPAAVLNQIAVVNTSNPHKGAMVSATSLKPEACIRKLKLTREEDYHEEPRRMYDAVRGSLIHGFLECDLPHIIAEKRLYKRVDDWVISGQIDWYDTRKKTLEDYKTMADKGTYILYRVGYKEDHAVQLNIYRWLMHGGHIGSIDGEQVFWDVDRMIIHYIMMNRTVSSGRVVTEIFSEFKPPNYGKTYPLEIGRKNAGPNLNGTPQWHVTFNLPDIPIWPLEETEAYVKRVGPGVVKALLDKDHMPPGVLHDKEQLWQCDWCPVRRRCGEIEDEIRLKEFDQIPLEFDE
jgi:hypothetical protein